MSKYIVKMIDAYTGETIDVEEEIFNSESEADDFACEWGSNFSAGAETLSLMGREYTPREDVEFVVEELDED